MTTTDNDINKIISYTEVLTDYELNILLNAARESDIIKKDGGLEEFYKALEKSTDDDQKAEIFQVLANIVLGVEGPSLAGEFLMTARNFAKSSEVKTKINTYIANYRIALQQYSKAEESIDAATNTVEIPFQKAEILNSKALLNFGKGDYEGAISLLNMAATIYKKGEEHEKRAEIHTTIGNAYRDMGENESALNSYREALRFAQKTKGKLPLSNLFFNLGELNLKLNLITPSITYFEDCLKDRTDPVLTIKSLRNLAQCYSVIGGDEEADKLYSESLALSRSLPDEQETTTSLEEYAAFLLKTGQIEESKSMLEDDFDLRSEYIGRTNRELDGSWRFAQLYHELNSKLNEDTIDLKEAKAVDDSERALLSGEIVSEVRELIEMMHHVMDRPRNIAHDYENLTLKEAVRVFKKEFLTERLANNNWDKNKLAHELGVTLSNLYHHLETLGMNK
ncbi:tetratricopeptide repeat protein [Candidatus Marinimicrobia bacterium MT.SAG.2]|nr:tetratricopeptide repeat protein [Candidatus Marinimicrobia bacterium MT.SAG.2]